jgi:hypothetical protein
MTTLPQQDMTTTVPPQGLLPSPVHNRETAVATFFYSLTKLADKATELLDGMMAVEFEERAQDAEARAKRMKR